MIKLFFCLFLTFSLFSPKIYAQFAQGYKIYMAREYEEAIPYFEATLEKEKNNKLAKDCLFDCLFTLFERYQKEKNYEKAVIFLEKTYKYFPNDPRLKVFTVPKELYEKVMKNILKESPLPSELKVKLKVLAATISRTKGKVLLQPKMEKIWIPVEVNSPVYPEDKIKTDENSECEIIFDDGTALKVGANSQVTLDSAMADETYTLKRFDVGVENGEVLSNVEKFIRPESKFGIRTPTAVIGVRGTKLMTVVRKDRTTEVAVFDGMVIIAGLMSTVGVSVEEGKQTLVKPGEDPLPPFAFTKEFLEYQVRIIPLFDESVIMARKELDKFILRRAEWIKKQQEETKEKKQLKTLKKVENIDFLLHSITIEKLNFSPEQLKSLKELKEIFRKGQKIKFREINQGEAELKNLLTAEEVDLTKVETKLQEISALRAKLRYLEIAAFENGKMLLTLEQKEKLKELLAVKEEVKPKTK